MQPPELPPDDRFKYCAELRTRWSDDDAQLVLNNAVYLTLFEEARLRYFGDLELIEHGVFPFVLAQTNVRFVAPGRGGRAVHVRVCTTRLGRTSMEQVYRACDAETGEVWAEAESLLVGWDTKGRRKAPWNERFRAAVSGFEGGELA